jgi:peptidyl-prolyl cis-trans isomerase D
MLQDIRKHTEGTAAKIVVGLIIVSFAFFGIERILLNGGGNKIAEVNGDPIYPQELQQALETQKRRLMAVMGNKLDPSLLEDDNLKPQAMESLINRKLLMQSAAELKLAVSEREIGALVGSMKQFQVDGAFSADLYKNVLAGAGYSPAYFKQSLHDDMLLNQLRSGLAGSEFVTPIEKELNTHIIWEQRDLRYFTIPIEKFTSTSPVTDAQVDAYYAAHQNDFRSEESADLDYLELTLDDYRQPVEESAILEAYELSKQDAQYKTQNRVSHILFEPGDAGDVQQRVAKAQEKLASGVSFAEVAKEFSQDAGSAEKGGDLGYSTGDTFPQPMEAAIAQLAPGVVSGPIQSDAGTHLILVTERKQGQQPGLEEVRQQLQDKIQAEQARAALLHAVESLKDLAFNAEDLGYPAKELNLPVKQADNVTRTQKEGLFSNKALVDAAFSEDTLNSGNNSEVIELAADHYVVLHVRKHNTPEVKPLASVKNEVVAAIRGEMTRAAVTAEADRALKRLRGGLAADQFAQSQGYPIQVELGIDRRNSTVPPEVLRRVFDLPTPTADKTATDFVMTPNGDAIVIELMRVNPGEYKTLSDADKAQLQQVLNSESGSLINDEFQRGLRERANIAVL